MVQDLLVQDGGYFNNRLKYIRNRKKALLANEAGESSSNDTDVETVYTQENAESDLQILKRTVFNSSTDMDMIKIKLNATCNFRSELMSDENIDIREYFPFFFSNPHLVR